MPKYLFFVCFDKLLFCHWLIMVILVFNSLNKNKN